MKIIDLINQPDPKHPIQVSLEFFPPKTPKGVENLKTRVEKMVQHHQPIFLDLTWGAGGGSITNETTRELTRYWHQTLTHPPINMHLTCTNMPLNKIKEVLEEMYQHGIQNIVALRGDPPISSLFKSHFTCSLDLIQYIRKTYDNFFCITTAGYPEGHPDLFVKINDVTTLSPAERQRMVTYDDQDYVCPDSKYVESLEYLRQKCEHSDLIITQLFYDCDLFIKFVQDCRRVGITCPILPGIMLIQSYPGFQKMTKFCKTKVPQRILNHLETIKDQPDQVEAYGIKLAQEMCSKLIEKGEVKNIHLYTLNKNKSADRVINYLREKYPC
jgi:methylenetetrahydrofolate reductase (NADPH)